MYMILRYVSPVQGRLEQDSMLKYHLLKFETSVLQLREEEILDIVAVRGKVIGGRQ